MPDMLKEEYGDNVCDPCYQIFKLVDKLPNVQVATRNHAYVLPDGSIWALNRQGDNYVELTNDDFINIDSPDDSISVEKEIDKKNILKFHLKLSDLIHKQIDKNTEDIKHKQDTINLEDGYALVGVDGETRHVPEVKTNDIVRGRNSTPSVVSALTLKNAIDEAAKRYAVKYVAGPGIAIDADNVISTTVNDTTLDELRKKIEAIQQIATNQPPYTNVKPISIDNVVKLNANPVAPESQGPILLISKLEYTIKYTKTTLVWLSISFNEMRVEGMKNGQTIATFSKDAAMKAGLVKNMYDGIKIYRRRYSGATSAQRPLDFQLQVNGDGNIILVFEGGFMLGSDGLTGTIDVNNIQPWFNIYEENLTPKANEEDE